MPFKRESVNVRIINSGAINYKEFNAISDFNLHQTSANDKLLSVCLDKKSYKDYLKTGPGYTFLTYFFTDVLIAFAQSVSFFFDMPFETNFFSQNIGLSKICLLD